jgi:hypothetical protein
LDIYKYEFTFPYGDFLLLVLVNNVEQFIQYYHFIEKDLPEPTKEENNLQNELKEFLMKLKI